MLYVIWCMIFLYVICNMNHIHMLYVICYSFSKKQMSCNDVWVYLEIAFGMTFIHPLLWWKEFTFISLRERLYALCFTLFLSHDFSLSNLHIALYFPESSRNYLHCRSYLILSNVYTVLVHLIFRTLLHRNLCTTLVCGKHYYDCTCMWPTPHIL